MNSVNATHTASLCGETVPVSLDTWTQTIDALMARHPNQGLPKVEPITAPTPALAVVTNRDPCPLCGEDRNHPSQIGQHACNRVGATTPAVANVPTQNSTWTSLVVDDAAKARIEAQHRALAAGGVAIDTSKQYFGTGTRMADEGYATQTEREHDHKRQSPIEDIVNDVSSIVAREKRKDIVVLARTLASSLVANGRIAVLDGYTLNEQAIRGILARVDSPATGYLMGVRDRIAEERGKGGKRDEGREHADRRMLADVLRHELMQAPGEPIKLRVREGIGDVYAAVSTRYAPADAPEILQRIIRLMPSEARGTFAYDPTSTSWELRASVWTPTPVQEQAVGEAFEGYVSFKSADNGTSRLNGGGGVLMLRCLNASTYVAEGESMARNHIGRITLDVQRMLGKATKAIDVLVTAWGSARQETRVVGLPDGVALDSIPISQAIPGIWWGELKRERECVLAGVLPGRTAEHVRGLSAAYMGERRDDLRITKADMGQAWTRYIQGQSAPVRRDAEAAIGTWIRRTDKPLRYDADR